MNFIVNDDSQVISIYYNILPTDKNGFLAIALPYQGTLESNNKKWYSNELSSGSTVIFTNVTCSSSCPADEDEFTFTILGKLDSFILLNHNFQLPFSNGISSEVVDEFYEIANGTSYNIGWDKTSTSVQVTLNKKFDERISEPAGRLSLIPNENGGNNNVLNWNLDDGNTVFTIKYSDNESRELADFRLIWSGIGIGSGFSLIAAGIALVRTNVGLERLKKFIKVQRHMQDANTAFTLKNYEIAKQSYDLASKADPKDIDPLLLAGNSFYEMKMYEKAIPHYEDVLKINENHVGSLNNLGICYDKLERFEDSYNIYLKALEIDQNHYDTINNYGALALDIGFSDCAILCFEEVLDKNDKDILALTNKGKALKNISIDFADKGDSKKAEEKLEEAKKYFDTSLAINPNSTMTLTSLGHLLFDTGKITEALSCFQRSNKVEPLEPNTLYNIGICFLKLNKPQEALPFFDEYTILNPTNIAGLGDRGVTLSKLNRDYEAIEMYNKILELEPNNLDAKHNRDISLKKLTLFFKSSRFKII